MKRVFKNRFGNLEYKETIYDADKIIKLITFVCKTYKNDPDSSYSLAYVKIIKYKDGNQTPCYIRATLEFEQKLFKSIGRYKHYGPLFNSWQLPFATKSISNKINYATRNYTNIDRPMHAAHVLGLDKSWWKRDIIKLCGNMPLLLWIRREIKLPPFIFTHILNLI